MRQLAPHVILRYLVLGLVLALASTAPAFADDRQEARVHYQAGVKAYNAADYKTAIREFSQAQQLAPADLNNYNLALCYDKLGDAEPAIQYYRAYLDKVPGTDKRGEIDASIKRLESAAKSAAAKRAEEERKAEEARKVAEAKRLESEAAAKKAAEEEARLKAEEDARNAARNRPDVGEPVGPRPGVGSTGTPSSGVTPRGDAQLDRVQQIDINQIRDRGRRAPAPTGPDRAADPRRAPDENVGAGANASVGLDAGGNERAGTEVGNPSPDRGSQVTGTEPTPADDKPKATPVYKKWWFWVVVGVSAYVVYSIAADDSKQSQARMFENIGPAAPRPAGGLTLMRF
jgi:hypothetical protein